MQPNNVPFTVTDVTNSLYVNVFDEQIRCIVDTGAEISAIDSVMFDRLRALGELKLEKNTVMSLKGVGGAPLAIQGITWIPIRIGESIFKHPFYVLKDISFEMIIGIDFLNTQKAILNFRDKAMYIRNEKVRLSDTSVLFPVLSVVCKETVELPPLAQTLIQTKLSCSKRELESATDLAMIEPDQDFAVRKQLLGAKALVKVSETVPMIFLNVTNKKVKLYKGTVLGKATQISSSAPIAVLAKEHEDDSFVSFTDKEKPPKSDKPNVDLSSSDLTLEQKKKLENLLLEYRDVFANSIEELGRTSIMKHKIDTGDSRPIRQRPYRVSPKNKEEINNQVNNMLEQGIIRKSSSPWASPVILVAKPDGSQRMCIDLRKVNAVTKKDSYPLPRIDDTLDALGGKTRYLSTLDLMSGYLQVEMDPESREKTAFITHSGLYEYNVMPFGATNAPALFQRLMNTVFGDVQYKFLLIYLDDLVIYSSTFEEHLHHLEEVFKRLRAAGLTLKPSKCVFARSQVHFLGHVISQEGIRPNPEKVSAIEKYPVPKTVKDVRAFLGICNYYRRFVRDFAKKASPLVRLTRKDVKFDWNSQCQTAFETLKSALASDLVLAFPDFSKEFILQTDASLEGIGMVLSQVTDGKERPLAFAGRDLTPAERNYSATERECLAVVEGIKKFEPYLHSNPFTVITDHAALKWLMNIKDPKSRLAKWALTLQAYDMKIVHRAGTANGNADALSRIKYGKTVCVITTRDLSNLTDLAQKQREDGDLQMLIDFITEEKLPDDDRKARQIMLSSQNFEINDHNELEHIAKKRIGGSEQYEYIRHLVIPKSMRAEVLTACHDDQTGSHFGIDKTYQTIRDRYFWKGMFRDVENWIKSCTSCSTKKNPKVIGKAPLIPIPVDGPFDRVAVDVLGPLPPSTAGNRYIIVFSDYLTRWPEAFCCPNADAQTVAKLLYNEIICRHSSPRSLLSDRGANFLSKVVTETCRFMGIKKSNTSGYHPQCDGVVERFNRTLMTSLSMYTNSNQTDWDTFVPSVLFAYRVSPATQGSLHSPFMLLYGRNPKLPIDTRLIKPKQFTKTIDEHLAKTIIKLEVLHETARSNIAKAQQTYKEYYDRNARDPRFEIGDLVWVYTPRTKKGLTKKLSHFWHGPFQIVGKVSDTTFKVRTSDNRGIPKAIHANRMKPFYSQDSRPSQPLTANDDGSQELDENELPEDSFENDNDAVDIDNSTSQNADTEVQGSNKAEKTFYVEKITGHKKVRNEILYRIKWLGYPENESTWEPAHHINKVLIDAYHETGKRKTKTKSKRK